MVRLLVALTLTLKIYGASGAGAVTTVMVHLAHRTFTNQTVNVAAGDVVQFISLNPTGPFRVTQTSFSAPCRPLQNGFDSDYISGTAPYTVNVSELNPIWFYEDGLCTDGMVGAINAPSEGNTFDAFLAAVRSLGSNGSNDESSPSSPAHSTPASTGAAMSSDISTPSVAAGESTGTSSSTPTSRTESTSMGPSQPSSSSRPKNAGRNLAIAGGTVGAVALCLVLVVIALLCRRRRHRVRGESARIAPIPPPPYPSPQRAGKSSVSSETEPWRSETEDVRTELAQLRELVVTQLAPPPPQYHDIARVPSI